MSIKLVLNVFSRSGILLALAYKFYVCSTGYRQFEGFALQYYGSLKTPNTERIVQLH